ncbi:MAG: hypothetical protein JO097_19775 [Acidobacteriaceae bacterium]|nr:hypothetical protein [Acidobacteriaceae bacterium]
MRGWAGEHRFAPCLLLLFFVLTVRTPAQFLLKVAPGEGVTLMPSDMAILEADSERKDLPCSVTPRKADLGFDLRFHSGYEVTIPMTELAGSGEVLTVLFRVYPEEDKGRAAYFVQHIQVPPLSDEIKGDALLGGGIDIGEGKYHVDWLMRDRMERLCSSSWDIDAALAPKDKPIPLFLGPREIAQSLPEPFVNDSANRPGDLEQGLNVKLLVNFAPQNLVSPALRRSDTDALVTILKAIERDPHVGHISLVAFNIEESRVVYRQDSGQQIDFPSLGKALETMKLGTVNLVRLQQKHSDTDFLASLIEKEVGETAHPDAVIFAGPKAMLDADVPQGDLRRIGDIECPVFYMNYNLNPQAVPWKDSISHAIKAFKGTEYTISRPRDLWFSTTEMLNRIVRSKRDRALARAAAGGSE